MIEFPFLRKEKTEFGEKIIFVGSKMDIYIPKYFLQPEEGIANIIGNTLETLGLFWFSVSGSFYELQLPVKMTFQFSEKRNYTGKIKPQMPILDYTIFTLKTNDAFLTDVNYKQKFEDLAEFISRMIEGAKLPPTVNYNEVLPLFIKALEITNIKAKLGVPSLTIEFILSELFREKKNMSNPFRLDYDGKKSPFSYKMVRIVKVPSLNSTFTSIIGEDIKQQIVASVLRYRERKPEKISPIEKVMKY